MTEYRIYFLKQEVVFVNVENSYWKTFPLCVCVCVCGSMNVEFWFHFSNSPFDDSFAILEFFSSLRVLLVWHWLGFFHFFSMTAQKCFETTIITELFHLLELCWNSPSVLLFHHQWIGIYKNCLFFCEIFISSDQKIGK